MVEEEIQVVRSGATLSLSGHSTITYEIGVKGESQYIRLSGNSASGLFCKEWVSMVDIQQLLAGCAKVTSKTLQPLYAGKSGNSAGFLLSSINSIQKGSIPTETFSITPASEIPPLKKPAKKPVAKKIPT